MGDQRKRQRTESMIKISNQMKESKLYFEEANSHIKSRNLVKAIDSYNKDNLPIPFENSGFKKETINEGYNSSKSNNHDEFSSSLNSSDDEVFDTDLTNNGLDNLLSDQIKVHDTT